MGSKTVYRWLQTSLDWLLPTTCRLCGGDGEQGRELCRGCHADLPWITSACRCCGEPLPAGSAELLCGRCLRRPPSFEQVLAPLHFEPPIDRLIHAFKFRGDLAAGRLLATLLADAATERRPELLLPVPLHDRRLRQRGFNQSLEMARQLSRRHRLPLAANLLLRRRDTPAQHALPARARRANIRGAFELRGALPAGHIALIDDVLTTGHTAAEIARVLKRAGATRVEVWVVARA